MTSKRLYSVSDIARMARISSDSAYMYMRNHGLYNLHVGKRGRARLYTEDICNRLVEELAVPEGWQPLPQLASSLNVTHAAFANYVHYAIPANLYRKIRHITYLSPEAVEIITRHYKSSEEISARWRQSKRGRAYYESKDKQLDEWINAPVDESELILLDGYLLTPEQHLRRLRIRQKRFNDVPDFIFKHFQALVKEPNDTDSLYWD